jgi:hypothetical protein
MDGLCRMECACDMRNKYKMLTRKRQGKERVRTVDEHVDLEMSRLVLKFQHMVYENHGSYVNRER